MAEMKCIARIHTDFPQKFGIPRQSGLVAELKGTVVFEPEYRNPGRAAYGAGAGAPRLRRGFDGRNAHF